jgi:CRISPR-associated DxTHG motif protein
MKNNKKTQIITIVGTVTGGEENKRARYKYDESLKESLNGFPLRKHDYINMLPLLIENFRDNNTIIPVFTEKAKEVQIDVLKKEGVEIDHTFFDEKYRIKDEKDFYSVLSLINSLMSQDNEYIIDLTHGFRHIPILAAISIIAQGLNEKSKIKHILFAKEIVAGKEYEIIDLREYLELANISYVLENFADNYNVSSRIIFTDENFQKLNAELKTLSEHILSNSLQQIFSASVLKDIICKIDDILKNDKVATFKNSLEKIKRHIGELQGLQTYQTSKQFFEFSKLLSKKGYLLNAITLLFEAIGYYCVESFEDIADEVKKYIKTFEKRRYFKSYTLTSQSRKFVKCGDFEKYLYKSKEENNESTPVSSEEVKRIRQKIKDFISEKKVEDFQKFIEDAEDFRNNLSHGNRDKKMENPKNILTELTKKYEKFCIEDDVLGKKKQ